MWSFLNEKKSEYGPVEVSRLHMTKYDLVSLYST